MGYALKRKMEAEAEADEEGEGDEVVMKGMLLLSFSFLYMSFFYSLRRGERDKKGDKNIEKKKEKKRMLIFIFCRYIRRNGNQGKEAAAEAAAEDDRPRSHGRRQGRHIMSGRAEEVSTSAAVRASSRKHNEGLLLDDN